MRIKQAERKTYVHAKDAAGKLKSESIVMVDATPADVMTALKNAAKTKKLK